MTPKLDDEDKLDYCGECWEDFRYDDTGGYNPPCPCGCGMCRPCCEESKREEMCGEDAADYPYDEQHNPDGYR